jgi:hypothetical protein
MSGTSQVGKYKENYRKKEQTVKIIYGKHWKILLNE